MSFEFFLRLVGMAVLAAAGWKLGDNLAAGGVRDTDVMRGILSLSLAGAALGLLLTPYLTLRPLEWVRRRVRHQPANHLLSGAVGLLFGLILAALLAAPLSALPGALGQWLPLAAATFFGYAGIQAMTLRERDLMGLIQTRLKETDGQRPRYILLDTSTIIDGRIADVAQTGFLDGTLLVPNFVLSELQHIAGSREPLRRNRGKRGLEILNELQKSSAPPLEISDLDAPEVAEVDAKLVALARELGAPILTTDYNLNKVAELQGVRILNVNELANAVKTLLLPGESFQIEIIQAGREQGQGVGYLEDGTMVVVDQGQALIGQRHSVEVTRILQTVAGRMIFAHLPERSAQPSTR